MAQRTGFWSHIDATGDCWLWTAQLLPAGYGRGWLDGKMVVAHRGVYETLVGRVPDGLELDHLCRNRACVNPDHLEPVTPHENTRRRPSKPQPTVCPRGHPYTVENAYVFANGTRQCRACRRTGRSRGWFEAARPHCPAGHEYSPENTYQRPGSAKRVCRECGRIRNRRRVQVDGVRRIPSRAGERMA